MSAPKRKNGASVEHIEKACTGKLRFPDILTARAAGQHYGKTYNVFMYVYKCEFCKGWHMTRNYQSGGDKYKAYFVEFTKT